MATTDELLTRMRDRADDELFHQILVRVYRGLSELRRSGSEPGFVIVVSPQMYSALMTYGGRRSEGSLEFYPSAQGRSGDMRLRGLEVERDPSLGPTEIRLRSEVIL